MADLRSVPVAPGRLPGIGHLAALARGPLDFLVALRESGDIVRVDLGPKPVYFLTAPRLHRQALTSPGFSRGRIYERARTLFGNGLATSDGALHLRQRRLVQPLFHRAHVESYFGMMLAQARALSDSWSHGQVVAVDRAMSDLMLKIVVTALTSRDIGRSAAAEIHRLMPVIMKGIALRMITPVHPRFDAAADRLRALVGELILGYRASSGEGSDLLAMLVAADMSDEQICDEVVSLLMAGTETPSSTLAWIFHELAQHPSVEQRLHAEVDSAPVTLSTLGQLEYTRRVVTEALRLHPTLLFTLRATQDVSLGGVQFPAGVEVAYSPYALHRDPSLYPSPLHFDPDRSVPDVFSPFNFGVHKCVGEHFALAEMMVTVATVAARWSLRPCGPVREVLAIVPRPRSLPMRAVARVGTSCFPAWGSA
ncbi:cytochrome P450 [Allokutzneria sp. A3M-2-11 16]|uniref:cytochrome P450 n=1 Tax=Allokutzneria sp. A3M-2-11 16 TaxID=2962043 RepID=UPI0020B89CF5|nr:cytochrome P450 [Allokutzneria sp. A3M-2-11 16]MCP3800816.1 cytochrome P450 [Allokutzneria sp. A3M-2-11 16]